MRSASVVAIALLATLSLVAPTVAPVASAGASPADAAEGPTVDTASERSAAALTANGSPAQNRSAAQSDGLEPADPKTVIAVRLQENGDAVWTIRSRFRVNTSNESAAFDELVANVRSGRASVGYSRALFQRYANASAAATGRDMRIEDPRWFGTVDDGVGVLAYRFTWTNFSEKRGNWINVTDTFRSDSGTWFPALEDGQRLVVYPPEGYAVKGSPPDKGPRLSDGALVWEGPRTFEPGYLQAKYIEQAGGDGTTTDPGPNSEDADLLLILLGAGLLVLIVSVGAGGYFLARQQEEGDGDAPAGAAADGTAANGGATAEAGDAAGAPAGESGDSPADADPSATDGTVADAGADAAAGDAASGAAADTDGDAASGTDAGTDDGAAAGAAAGAAGEDDEVDVELLSDEERVERLLTKNGGRMKQANIVKETGWSNAKVSQLLSAMDDDDRIDKLRIGRENLITLPDEDVTDL